MTLMLYWCHGVSASCSLLAWWLIAGCLLSCFSLDSIGHGTIAWSEEETKGTVHWSSRHKQEEQECAGESNLEQKARSGTNIWLVSCLMQPKEGTNDTFVESNLHLLLAMFLAQHHLAHSSASTDKMMKKEQNGE
jgi:hypothetical protein